MHDSKQVLVFPNGFSLDLELCHLSDLLLYVSDIILHNNYTTLKVYTMVGDTPCQLYIMVGNTPWQLYTTAEEGTLAHHDLERCSAMRQRMIRYKAFITEHAGLEMILFCIGVNTSDVSLICLFRS